MVYLPKRSRGQEMQGPKDGGLESNTTCRTSMDDHKRVLIWYAHKTSGLRVRPPGIEWKTGRNPKMGKNWPNMDNGPRPEMGKKWPQNGKKWIWGHFSIFSPFLGHFYPISGRGPFSIFWPIFSHFWISARFPFYTRRPDSQT